MATILLIETASEQDRGLDSLLQQWGYAVIRQQVVEAALRQGEVSRADVILLDMPPAEGIRTLQQLNALQVSTVPVIFLSASNDEDLVVRALDAGAYDYETKPVFYPLLNARIRAALRLKQNQQSLSDANRNLARLASQDPLTKACNRRCFLERADAEIDRARRYDRPLSVMMLDVDRFKAINDRFGHAMGDHALIELTMVCNNNIRSGDFVARMGGEEFAICCPDASLEGARRMADRICQAIDQHEVRYQQQHCSLTVSVGVTSLREQDRNLQEIMDRVDRLLYRAKQQGRNRVVFG